VPKLLIIDFGRYSCYLRAIMWTCSIEVWCSTELITRETLQGLLTYVLLDERSTTLYKNIFCCYNLKRKICARIQVSRRAPSQAAGAHASALAVADFSLSSQRKDILSPCVRRAKLVKPSWNGIGS
jgi:hypothetical protein